SNLGVALVQRYGNSIVTSLFEHRVGVVKGEFRAFTPAHGPLSSVSTQTREIAHHFDYSNPPGAVPAPAHQRAGKSLDVAEGVYLTAGEAEHSSPSSHASSPREVGTISLPAQPDEFHTLEPGSVPSSGFGLPSKPNT